MLDISMGWLIPPSHIKEWMLRSLLSPLMNQLKYKKLQVTGKMVREYEVPHLCVKFGASTMVTAQKFYSTTKDNRFPIIPNCTHFLGSVARNGRYAPLHYKSWHKMPKVLKEDMFALALVSLILSCIYLKENGETSYFQFGGHHILNF